MFLSLPPYSREKERKKEKERGRKEGGRKGGKRKRDNEKMLQVAGGRR